jgi:hypothetical protein
MFMGGRAARYCIEQEIEHQGPIGWVVLGGLAVWGALATWNVICDLKFQRDRARAILEKNGLFPCDQG